LRTQHLKLVGAAGAAALTVGVLAGPAIAAPQDVSYSCFGGALTIPITMDAGTLPAKLVAGQSVKQTIGSGVVHLPIEAVGVAQGQGWDALTAKTASSSGTPFSLKVGNTAIPVPPAPPAAMDVPATGAFTIKPSKAGTFTVKAGDMTATIQGFIGGVKANAIPLDCVAPTDGTNVFGTIPVSKDSSKTTTKASYSAAKDTATGTAKVAGSKFKLAGTGKIKFTLKKGTKTIASKMGTLSKGSAKASFTKVKAKGKYSVTAQFTGDAALKGSSDKASFTVK
jgi:hypothetical protein